MSAIAKRSEASCAVSIHHSFVLQWTLKAKDLNDLSQSDSDVSSIISDLYRIESITGLYFYLDIHKKDSKYVIRIKSFLNWRIKLARSLLETKDRVYALNVPPQLAFLPSLDTSSVLEEGDVTFHLLFNAGYLDTTPTTDEDNFDVVKGQEEVYLDTNISLPSDYTNQDVIDFIILGDIPTLGVGMALDIIDETPKHKCEVLKLICAEYLRNNITARNIRSISATAIRHDLRHLERTCMLQIANGKIYLRY